VEGGFGQEAAVVAVEADTVRAAGGVVWREGPAGEEVLLVHRPKYDDWSLPKGKLEPGETDEEAAVREVAEETGLQCRLGDEIGSVSYIDRRGRPKVVRYWSMEAGEGEFTPHDEVDAVQWVGLDEARRVLSYDTDRRVLDQFARRR
jgi:8-oxo-dGTP pyrophosphatase MutT (NUDIX family)